MKWLAYSLAVLGAFTSMIVIPVAINLTDYRQDLLPYGWISFGVFIVATLLVLILETRAFLTRKKTESLIPSQPLHSEPAPAGAGRPQATGTVLLAEDSLSQSRSLWRKLSRPRQNLCTPAHGSPKGKALEGGVVQLPQLRNSRTPWGCCGVAVVAAVETPGDQGPNSSCTFWICSRAEETTHQPVDRFS